MSRPNSEPTVTVTLTYEELAFVLAATETWRHETSDPTLTTRVNERLIELSQKHHVFDDPKAGKAYDAVTA